MENPVELSLVPAEDFRISHDTEWLIGGVAKIKEGMDILPSLTEVSQVEKYRLGSQAVQTITRKWLGDKTRIGQERSQIEEIERYAKRFAVMCQRRIGQIRMGMDKNKGGRPRVKTPPPGGGVSGKPPTLKDLGLSENFAANAQVLAGMSEKELGQKLDAGMGVKGIVREKRARRVPVKPNDPQRAALTKAIKAEYKKKGQEIDDRHARELARWRANAAAKREEERGAPPDPFAQKFGTFWRKVKNLIGETFLPGELDKLGPIFSEELGHYIAEQKDSLSHRREERERQKAVAELMKPV